MTLVGAVSNRTLSAQLETAPTKMGSGIPAQLETAPTKYGGRDLNSTRRVYTTLFFDTGLFGPSSRLGRPS